MPNTENKLKGVQIEGSYTGRDNITYNNYNSGVNDEKDFGIIDEIFKNIIDNLRDNNSLYKDDGEYVPPTDKIKINFEDLNEQEEVIQYFKFAYLKIHLIQKRIEEEDNYSQINIASDIYTRYMELKRIGKKNMEILINLFDSFIISGKERDPDYTNIARAFVLFYFDDCTIFEKK